MGFLRSCGYERLSDGGMRPRRRWVKRVNGGLKGLQLARSRKLTLKVLSVLVSPRRIARIYADLIHRMNMDGAYPSIIFSTQWGLPVLSHNSSTKSRTYSVTSMDRKLARFC